MQTLRNEYCFKYRKFDDNRLFENACNKCNLEIRELSEVLKSER